MGDTEVVYETLFWSNLYQALAAFVAATAKSEFRAGLRFLRANPALRTEIAKFACCGAMGQVCVFYAVANFDNVLCTAVTTTRKLFSVLLSLAEGNKSLPPTGWMGLALASFGIMGELANPHASPNKVVLGKKTTGR